jgi:hypothetical protein
MRLRVCPIRRPEDTIVSFPDLTDTMNGLAGDAAISVGE